MAIVKGGLIGTNLTYSSELLDDSEGYTLFLTVYYNGIMLEQASYYDVEKSHVTHLLDNLLEKYKILLNEIFNSEKVL